MGDNRVPLPWEPTCQDCRDYEDRCSWLFQKKPDSTQCQYDPSAFVGKLECPWCREQLEEDELIRGCLSDICPECRGRFECKIDESGRYVTRRIGDPEDVCIEDALLKRYEEVMKSKREEVA